MVRTTNNRGNVIYSCGSKKREEVKLLLEAIVKIAKVDRASNVVNLHQGRAATSVGDLKISICAPYHLRLNAASKRKYLKTLFASDPFWIPFQLDVWTPFKKVLNVEYDGSTHIIVSFRRGIWEDSLISAAKNIPILYRELVTKPTTPISAAQGEVRQHHTDITITQKQWDMIREILLHDRPFFNPIGGCLSNH